MTAPTLINYVESTWTDALGTAETTGSLTWQVGDLVVVFGGTENGAFALNTPTASGSGLSFTLTSQVGSTGSDAHAYLWLAVATVASSGTISAAPANAGTLAMRGISVWQYRGSDGLGATVASLSASSAKAVSLARGGANSMVGFGAVDWNAVAAGTALAPAGGTLRENSLSTGRAAVVVGDWGDQGSAGTTSYGYTGGGTPKNYGFAWEVLGSAGTGGTATVTGVAISATGSVVAPLMAASSAVGSAPAAASGSVAVPVVSARSTVAATTMAGSGGMTSPLVAASSQVVGIAMGASGGISAPAPAGGSPAAVAAPPMAAAGDLRTPTTSAALRAPPQALVGSGRLATPHVDSGSAAVAQSIDLPTELALAECPTTLTLASNPTTLTLASRPTTLEIHDRHTTLSLDG